MDGGPKSEGGFLQEVQTTECGVGFLLTSTNITWMFRMDLKNLELIQAPSMYRQPALLSSSSPLPLNTPLPLNSTVGLMDSDSHPLDAPRGSLDPFCNV